MVKKVIRQHMLVRCNHCYKMKGLSCPETYDTELRSSQKREDRPYDRFITTTTAGDLPRLVYHKTPYSSKPEINYHTFVCLSISLFMLR